ncbi:MAG: ABC transporter permease [Propionibacteriaceae bacterium]|nr:ABC transporter permease [Propionibacteriaceae bacterium]
MYLLTNAAKNLARNKGRNLLVGVILFTIIVAASVSVLINSTAGAVISDYKSRFGSQVFLDLDYEKAIAAGNYDEYEGAKGVQDLTPDQNFKFADSKYLHETKMTASAMINFPDAVPLDNIDDPDLQARGYLIGSNEPNISKDFESGARKIVEGRAVQAPNEAIISKQFAELNKLKIGDNLDIVRTGNKKELPLKIVGIFEDNTMLGAENNPYMQKNPLLNRNNEILVGIDTVKEFGASYVDASYFLNSPDDLDAFEAELRDKGLPDYYKLRTDEAGYQAVVGPVEGLTKLTTTFMIVVLALGAVILLLISTLAVRERKYEIGVLRAMGMRKTGVAIGFVAEMLIMTLFCLAIGFAVSAVISQPIADSLLRNQIELAAETAKNGMGGVTSINAGAGAGTGAGADSALTPLSQLTVALTAGAISQISLIALALAVVSSAVGIVYITRFEPMKILSERN